MKYFDFDNLIRKYSVDFIILTQGKDTYDEYGDLIKGADAKVTKHGAIIGINERRIYKSDGYLTEKDKDLYMTESLGEFTNVTVIYGGNRYKVETNPQNNAQFTGVYQYTLKWVSAFKGRV